MFIFIALGPDCDCGVRHALPASGCLLSLSLPSHTCLWVFGSAASGHLVFGVWVWVLGDVCDIFFVPSCFLICISHWKESLFFLSLN